MHRFFTACVILAAATLCAPAQDYRARVQGSVADSSQAVVPGARVVLRNIQTGVEVVRQSGPSGQYLFDFVDPGTYTLTCEQAGFHKFVQENLAVRVRGDVTLNVVLTVGQIAETVTVSETPADVQFNSTTLEMVVDRKMLEELPQLSRNPFNLATLDPAVTSRYSTPDKRYPFFMWSSSRIDVGGATSEMNDLLLDGAPLMVGNKGSYAPPMDAVQEFTVQQNSVDAEYGHSAGGILSIAMKSGTNELHGTAYYFGRNPALNARSNAVNNSLNRTRNNIGGASGGGPIRKNKLFTFASYEMWRAVEFASQINTTKPTALEMAGDFSKTLNRAGGLRVIYDPWTTQLDTATNKATRMPFAGNVLPANRIDRTGKMVMGDQWLPNNPGDDIMGTNNFKAGSYRRHRYFNFSDRTDWNLNDRWKVYGRFSRFQNTLDPEPYAESRGLTLNGGIMNSQNVTGDAVYTITPTTVLNLRGSYASIKDDLGSREITEKDLEDFWPNNAWYKPYLKDLKAIFYPGMGSSLGRTSAWYQRGHTYNFYARISQQRGRHYLKFGTEYRRYAQWVHYPQFIDFDSTNAALTADTYISPVTTMSGSPWATLLLGAMNSGTDSYVAPQEARSHFHSLYVQDDFKVSNRLTLNLGLRWEYETPPWDTEYRFTRYLDLNNPIPEMQSNPPRIPSAVTDIASLGYRWNGALVFTDDSRRGMWNSNRHLFMPRVGAAYRINDRTSLRFGYARYIVPTINAVNIIDSQSPAYGFTVSSSILTPQTGIPRAVLSNPFPSSENPLQSIPGKSLGRYTQLGNPVSWNYQDLHPGVNDRYDLSLQRELPAKVLADVNFFMNQGHSLAYSKSLNMADPTYSYTYKSALDKTVANPFYDYLPVEKFPGSLRNSKTVSIGSLLKLYPQYGSLTQANSPGARSHQYSLQVRVRRAFSRGFSLNANYASSLVRSTAFFSNVDQYLDQMTYRDSGAPRHRFNLSGTFEVPLGKGRRWFSTAPRLVDFALGGWSFSPLLTYDSGTWISFGALQVVKAGSPKLANPTRDKWFDTSYFVRQPSYTDRSNPVYYPGLTGPRQWNLDTTLSKSFRVNERFRVELRMEAYNTTNSIMWGQPNLSVDSALFGRITSQNNRGRELQYTLRVHF